MLLSKLFGTRFKEKPADAFMTSHIFLIRGGYVKQVGSGLFSLLPPAKRISEKINALIRSEMDKAGGQEVLFPVVLPAELWKESGRYQTVGSELLRFTDRTGQELVLGMTHEEAAVQLARDSAHSFIDYPFMIYQIQTKFRDEPRSRGGLIRVREFTMKDAYSFHTSKEDLEEFYEKMLESYNAIFKRAGLKNIKSIRSDSGMMGGSVAHEFMYLSKDGEDALILCENCGYAANRDVALAAWNNETQGKPQELEKVYTPDITDIASLADSFDLNPEKTIKSTVFKRLDTGKMVVVFIRGDLDVNETQVTNLIKAPVAPYTDYDLSDLAFGFIGPLGLDSLKNNYDLEIFYDRSLSRDIHGMVCGANEKDHHFKGLDLKRDLKISEFVDVASVNEGDSCIQCNSPLKLQKGIEIGNIFQLGTRYTEPMGMSYLDQSGKEQIPVMGCYGIGVGRLLACIIEENHDAYGPIWPKSIAPWQIHICVLNNNHEEVNQKAKRLYASLSKSYEVLLDDRKVSAGVQFNDADLLGVPIRIVVSRKNHKLGEVEVATRDKSFQQNVSYDELKKLLKDLL